MLVGGIYLAANPRMHVHGVARLLPPARRVTVLRAMHDTGNALRLWLIGQGVVMLSMGLMMWAAYAWLGLPSAAALALIAALADFVPFIGPILGALPALVIASTIDVFWTLLRNQSNPVHRRFVVIPLELRDPTALASLTMITTVVPGTVWCELARDSSAMLLHVWNVPDKAEFIAAFKRRYEQPLIRIFEQ